MAFTLTIRASLKWTYLDWPPESARYGPISATCQAGVVWPQHSNSYSGRFFLATVHFTVHFVRRGVSENVSCAVSHDDRRGSANRSTRRGRRHPDTVIVRSKVSTGVIPGTRVGRTYTEMRSERCVLIGRSMSRSAHTDLRLRLADARLRFIVLFERARRHLRVFIGFITVPKRAVFTESVTIAGNDLEESSKNFTIFEPL